MKFFAIHIEDLESEKFLSASNDQIATWLYLHALCSKLCNGGTIPDAASFPDRFWSRHGIDKATLDQASPLWSWNGDELTVMPYDIDGQTLFEKKVAGGKAGADKRWNGSPNGSPNAPDPTLPNITQHNPTRQTTSSDAGGGGFFDDETKRLLEKKHELFDYWNNVESLPKIIEITGKRKKNLELRMKNDFFKANWKAAIDIIVVNPFLTGSNERGWKANIDWFLQPESIVNIMERKYATKSEKSPVSIGRRTAPNLTPEGVRPINEGNGMLRPLND